MKKFVSILILSMLFSLFANAYQSDTSITYLDYEEKPVDQSRAQYLAITYPYNDYWARQIYKITNNKLYCFRYFTDKQCTNAEGPCTYFHENQIKSEEGKYHDNKKYGIWRSWFDNGSISDSMNYMNGHLSGINISWFSDGKIRDSTILDENGNGSSKSWWADGKLNCKGSMINGMKDGQWEYFYHKSDIKCQSVLYKADSAVSYICFDEAGNSKTKDCYYEKEADCKEWLNYLKRKLTSVKMPAKYNNGEVWGKVYIQFTVDTAGKTTDIKVIKSVDPDLDKIAVDIIAHSPAWEPAIQYNRKVKAYRTQPITFSRVE
jgi:TonB family protein